MLKELLRDSTIWCLLRIFEGREEAEKFLREGEELASLLEDFRRNSIRFMEILLEHMELSNQELEDLLTPRT